MRPSHAPIERSLDPEEGAGKILNFLDEEKSQSASADTRQS
jgi:hypothetical protein